MSKSWPHDLSKIKDKKTLHKYHLTAIIDRNITYPDKKTGKYIYTGKEHNKLLKGHDKLTDSRVIEAINLEELKENSMLLYNRNKNMRNTAMQQL